MELLSLLDDDEPESLDDDESESLDQGTATRTAVVRRSVVAVGAVLGLRQQRASATATEAAVTNAGIRKSPVLLDGVSVSTNRVRCDVAREEGVLANRRDGRRGTPASTRHARSSPPRR